MSNYSNRVIALIIEKTGAEDVTVESYFEDDLNIGEMELIEILTELEEEYHAELIESKKDIETVQNLVDLITEQTE